MRKVINKVHLEGYVHSHELSVKTVQNKNSDNFGKEFINGILNIQTDEEGLNVVQVHYSYVTPTNKSGSQNRTYTVLKQIIDEDKTVASCGMDGALKVKIDSSVALNDFYNQEDQLVSAKRIDGGFVTIVSQFSEDPAQKCYFDCDMVMTNFKVVEPEDGDPYGTVSGYVFDFRNRILPLSFSVRDNEGIQFFEKLSPTNSEPTFTRVWGTVVSKTTYVRKEIESAFGGPRVQEFTSTFRDWMLTGLEPEFYELGTDITGEELKKAIADREVYLAAEKARSDEYKASKKAGGGSSTVATATAAQGGFDF